MFYQPHRLGHPPRVFRQTISLVSSAPLTRALPSGLPSLTLHSTNRRSSTKSKSSTENRIMTTSKLIVTFIRHGQSEDNVKSIWAGWKDAPLSELGNKQAAALGRSLSSTHLTHIYASPLLRAHQTAQHVLSFQAEPKPPLTLNPNIREQKFGIAEGHGWTLQPPQGVPLEKLYADGLYPVLYGREEKFPGGESLNDLRERARKGLRESVLSHLNEVQGGADVHIALASHGLCIGELVAELVSLDTEAKDQRGYTGLMNTAWTRAEVKVRDGHGGPIDPINPPSLEVKITHVNEKAHLDALKDIPPVEDVGGSQAEAKAFFGGARV
ncbi:histidine phosphatase superfamily [Crepidotus variabilis]|uniref:Histidine phosphatase superfamily n=1 Tax=Crepidotus variabilis TaxID=179855 RepID=A0A9P6EG67_9AGAR|nr:histidine phosphatase superfamily [Crepidotus variabilis]